MDRPLDLFDREHEWADLDQFATAAMDGPRLGVVHGRRRQGKSYLVRHLAEQTPGLYHQALEEERGPALAGIGALVAADAGIGGAVPYRSWQEALGELVRRAGEARPIILDEFPYLLAKAPELPSVIQAVFDDARSGRAPSFRLLLCGSAISIMSELLSGQKALRGRASLDLSVRPFDYRQAAAFWRIEDPELAFLVHAVVGGTPGYRALLEGPAPATIDQFADWLFAGVLNPSHAMFREADYLLTEDPAISDRALYQSVLAAIADGRSTRSAVGSLLERDDSALRHPLLVLERAGFIRRDEDLWRAKRPLLRLDDPFLRFHFAVIRRNIPLFEARKAAEAWAESQGAFAAQVLGPHFEQLARTWTERFASADTLGGRATHVGFTQVNDIEARSRVELDVVAVRGNLDARRPHVLAVGEAKGGSATRTMADLHKLERGRVILGEKADVSEARLLLFSRSGFAPEVHEAARLRPDLELVDLERIYAGT
jgi:AAA+ ATPase superfamily predicted ATPase